ncbi:hypothetical protein FPQ18DRAFT_302509 [Pyronema domesticum]|nr:hypothetical protein FPQ18DRAFT_302509 [Pyronema domesticum]
MSSGIVTNSQSLTTDELHYLTHPTFFLGAFKSEPLLVLDSGTASVRSVVSSKYSLHDFNYDLFGENAITPDHFPSAYEFNFARNASLTSDIEEEEEEITPPEEQLLTDRDEIRRTGNGGPPTHT